MLVLDGPLFCPLDLFLFLFLSHSLSCTPSIVASFSSRMVRFFCPQDIFISYSHSHPVPSHFPQPLMYSCTPSIAAPILQLDHPLLITGTGISGELRLVHQHSHTLLCDMNC